MRWLNDVWFRLRALFGRGGMENELDEEIRFHLEMQTQKHIAGGMTPEKARRQARVEFGGEDRFKEHAREAWGVTLAHDLGGDVRFSLRQFARNPGFTAVATLTLALGIGGTVALFSVVSGLMLRPLPVVDEDRVVVFWAQYNWRGVEFDFAKERVQSFDGLAAFSNDGRTLRTDAGSSLLLAGVASAELFDVVGTPPLLGRTFRDGEDRPGAEPVVVLGHNVWMQHFGGDPTLVGGRIDLDGEPTTVIGVMPEGFYFPSPEAADVWVPLDLDPASQNYQGNGWLILTGRVRDGVTLTQVQADLNALAGDLGERFTYPDQWDKTRSPHVIPLREYVLGDTGPALLFLLGAVGLVLLMACANVAALILTRTADRAGEMSVRVALGAGRGRLGRQVITESVTLGLVAGVLGMALAAGAFDALVASLPLTQGFGETLSMDWTAAAASLGLAVLAGILVALAPMRGLLRGDLTGVSFGTRQTGGTAGGGRMQNALVTAEVLLAVVLATGATLLVRTVGELRSLDPGFESRGVLTMDVQISQEATTEEERALFFDALVERAAALPGVQAAGLINRVPIRDGGWQAGVAFPDRPDLDGERRPTAYYRPVTPETFDVLGVELVAGRGILPSDRPGGPNVAVINETFARRIWGNRDPIGRTISNNNFTDGPIEVVGVVRNIAVTELTGEAPMAVYYPWDQSLRGSSYGILMVKAELDATSLGPALRGTLTELDPRAAPGRIETMDQVLDGAMAEPLRLRFFLALFTLLGIVLGVVGVYGTVSYSVQRRQAEFGLRMALGAEPRVLLSEVVRGALVPVVSGVVGGTAVALWASSAVSRFLFEVQPTDPVSLLTAGGVLLLAGVAAALVPAVRASATDPAVALRAE